MRERLVREQAVDYQVLRSNFDWPDHQLRTYVTAGLIAARGPRTVLDPACGDGSIVAAAHRLRGIVHGYFGDISEANIYALKPSMKSTCMSADVHLSMAALARICLATGEALDMIVLTEILEHIPDPDLLLRQAAAFTNTIVVSSPEMRVGQIDRNPEHVWQFDGDGYYDMLKTNGWLPREKVHLGFRNAGEYDFQIWVAERDG